jgi:hypothetical protein
MLEYGRVQTTTPLVSLRSNTTSSSYGKIMSTNWSCAILPLAHIALAILVPAASAQQSGSSACQTTSEGSYGESKFELATTDPSRDTAIYSMLGFSVVAKTSYGYALRLPCPVIGLVSVAD